MDVAVYAVCRKKLRTHSETRMKRKCTIKNENKTKSTRYSRPMSEYFSLNLTWTENVWMKNADAGRERERGKLYYFIIYMREIAGIQSLSRTAWSQIGRGTARIGRGRKQRWSGHQFRQGSQAASERHRRNIPNGRYWETGCQSGRFLFSALFPHTAHYVYKWTN